MAKNIFDVSIKKENRQRLIKLIIEIYHENSCCLSPTLQWWITSMCWINRNLWESGFWQVSSQWIVDRAIHINQSYQFKSTVMTLNGSLKQTEKPSLLDENLMATHHCGLQREIVQWNSFTENKTKFEKLWKPRQLLKSWQKSNEKITFLSLLIVDAPFND